MGDDCVFFLNLALPNKNGILMYTVKFEESTSPTRFLGKNASHSKKGRSYLMKSDIFANPRTSNNSKILDQKSDFQCSLIAPLWHFRYDKPNHKPCPNFRILQEVASKAGTENRFDASKRARGSPMAENRFFLIHFGGTQFSLIIQITPSGKLLDSPSIGVSIPSPKVSLVSNQFTYCARAPFLYRNMGFIIEFTTSTRTIECPHR